MKKKNYRIKSSVLYASIILGILILLLSFYRNELYEIWKKYNGMEKIEYTYLDSKLKNQKSCYLCGNSNKSLVDYYHKEGEIGIICLSNWFVTYFPINPLEEQQASGTSSTLTNIDGVSISTVGIPDRGMASIDVNLPDGKLVDYDMLRENLCQRCIDKVAGVLEYSKWKVEDKEPIPLCVVDFESLELYSVQSLSCKYSVRNYWIVAYQKENEVTIDAYDLPYRKKEK